MFDISHISNYLSVARSFVHKTTSKSQVENLIFVHFESYLATALMRIKSVYNDRIIAKSPSVILFSGLAL